MIKKELAKLSCVATMISAVFFPVTALSEGVLEFYIDGDTYNSTYTITNKSTSGENVLAFGLQLINPYIFDTAYGPPGIDSPEPFRPYNSSVVGYTGPLSFADGATKIDFTFNDFAPDEQFLWKIDVDTPTEATVYANELIGSTAYVDFSNGLRGTGMLEAVAGQPEAAQFVIRSFAPSPVVPEPASWAMMLTGFGLAGAVIRVRRKNVHIKLTA